ncbi:MAG: ROK family protein, partial [Solirubrobacterales bacterium]|nr:ROK family protein [Solirubrobacterales bacterium]
MERASGPPLRGGIDLGGTKIEAIVADAGHEVLGSSRHPTPSTGGPEAVAAELVAAIKDACEGAGAEPAALQGVGVGSPGVVDEATGAVSTARNLPDWEGSFELGATLSRELGTPVFVGNDVQVATDAEFALGAGRPYGSLLGVMWGTGVGGGIILDQKPWLGRGG